MKTIEQTKKYLSFCIFDDDDWGRVLSFCREQYGGGNAHRPKRGQYHITFIDFLIWFKYMPGQGDAVIVGDLIGIVGKCTPFIYTLCAYIGQDGCLIQKEMNVFPHKVKIAEHQVRKMLFDKIFHAHLSYSINLNTLSNIYVPINGEFVIVKIFQSVKHGIFDCLESSSYHFYYLDNDNDAVAPVSLPASECELESAASKDIFELLEYFSRLGVMWSPKDKKFYPVPTKADFGGKYWYIDDKFCVCQSNDMQTPVHKERYRNGNYFTSYGEALLFLKRLKDLRMELNRRLE